MTRTIVVLEGDQTGQTLLEEGLRVIHPSVTGVAVEFKRYDLSLANRRATKNAVVKITGNRCEKRQSRAVVVFNSELPQSTCVRHMDAPAGAEGALLMQLILLKAAGMTTPDHDTKLMI